MSLPVIGLFVTTIVLLGEMLVKIEYLALSFSPLDITGVVVSDIKFFSYFLEYLSLGISIHCGSY
jgi:hypothetical protein